MKAEIITVNVPQVGTNDQNAEIIEWNITDKNKVSTGESICNLETAKAVFDVKAEASGFLIHLAKKGNDVEINQVIALIGPNLEKLMKVKDKYIYTPTEKFEEKENDQVEIKVTKKASQLAKELNIDLSNISTNGIIKETDIIKYSKIKLQINELPIEINWDRNKIPLVIYSSGKGAVTGKECIDLVGKYEVACFIDDSPIANSLCDLPIYHSHRLKEIINIGVRSIAVGGNGKHRINIYEKYKDLGIDFVNIIHPNTYISPSVNIGVGNYIKCGAIIETNSEIGNNCIIDNGVIIAHDNFIGDGVHIAPGSSLGSNIKIGKLAVLGIGCSVSTNITIGFGAIISVGSSVVKDVPENTVIEGVPGKEIGKRKN
jgi:sugar O-acyltransferase (sialic acid O-acetyltransferase NeuD family)